MAGKLVKRLTSEYSRHLNLHEVDFEQWLTRGNGALRINFEVIVQVYGEPPELTVHVDPKIVFSTPIRTTRDVLQYQCNTSIPEIEVL